MMGKRFFLCNLRVLGLAFFCLIRSAFLMAENGRVTLVWDPIQDPEVAGYTVVWGQASRAYNGAQNVSGTEATVSLEAGKTYYMAVRGFDLQGVAGELSEEVTAVVSGPDSVPPVISAVSVGNITSSSAIIAFSTSEEAYVQVEYGTSSALGSLTGLTTVSARTHAVTLTNLSNATTYSYRMIARDLSGNQVISEILTFRTQEGSDDPNPNPNAPIKFLQITLSNVSTSTVTINWTTDKVTTGLIEYGPSASIFPYNGTEVTNTSTHVTYLTGLTSSTLYRYRITATDSSNNRVTSGTLMFKTSDRLSQPARPSAEAIFIPSIVENGNFRTNLGINNLSKIIANVSMTLVDTEGLVLGAKTIQVKPDGLQQINSVARVLFENNLGGDVRGNLYLESDQPISAWASQIDNATNDPSMLLSKRNGSTRILIPSSANISTFSSSLVLMNVGYTTALISVKAYGTGGEVLGQTATTLSLVPNGVLSFENVLQSLGVSNNYGPIEINSLNNVPLIASSRVSSTNRAGGFFEGLKYSEASLVQTVAHVVDNSGIRTNLGINNVTDFAATVMVRFFDSGGQQLAAAPVGVPAKGLTQINNIVRQMLGLQDVSNREGYIRLESDQPIFAWASQIDNTTNDPGFAVSRSQGASRLLVQSTANVGTFKSSLVVVNTGSSDAIVDIVSRDTEGNVQGASRGILIRAGGFFSSANILETLGVTGTFGPVEIVSTNGQPVMATSRVYSTSGTSGFFEGQPIQ